MPTLMPNWKHYRKPSTDMKRNWVSMFDAWSLALITASPSFLIWWGSWFALMSLQRRCSKLCFMCRERHPHRKRQRSATNVCWPDRKKWWRAHYTGRSCCFRSRARYCRRRRYLSGSVTTGAVYLPSARGQFSRATQDVGVGHWTCWQVSLLTFFLEVRETEKWWLTDGNGLHDGQLVCGGDAICGVCHTADQQTSYEKAQTCPLVSTSKSCLLREISLQILVFCFFGEKQPPPVSMSSLLFFVSCECCNGLHKVWHRCFVVRVPHGVKMLCVIQLVTVFRMLGSSLTWTDR